jgi:hypothetical protein
VAEPPKVPEGESCFRTYVPHYTGDGELRAHAREPSAAPSYAQLLGAEVLPRTPLSHEGLRRLQAVAPGVLAASPGPRPRAEGRAIVVTGRDLPACQPPDH